MEKLIIFDFDGVLADSFDAWYKINAYAFKGALGKTLTKKQNKGLYTDSLNRSFRKFSGSENNYQKFKKFKEAHKERFLKYYSSQVKLFPFVRFLVSRLGKRGIKLVIVSSATIPEIIGQTLKKTKLENKFIASLSSKGEDKIFQLRRILASLKIKPNNAFFISDTYNDIKWGNKVGIKTVAVLWGFHDKKTLEKAKPDFIIKNYKELYEII